jgi:hypothetical protein
MMEKREFIRINKILLVISIIIFSSSICFSENIEEPANSYVDACQAIEGKTFYSLEKLERGLCPPGRSCLGNWEISFDKGVFHWGHSDVGESGYYKCNGWEIIGQAYRSEIKGYYDKETGILEWNGIKYKIKNEDSEDTTEANVKE